MKSEKCITTTIRSIVLLSAAKPYNKLLPIDTQRKGNNNNKSTFLLLSGSTPNPNAHAIKPPKKINHLLLSNNLTNFVSSWNKLAIKIVKQSVDGRAVPVRIVQMMQNRNIVHCSAARITRTPIDWIYSVQITNHFHNKDSRWNDYLVFPFYASQCRSRR